MEKTERWELWGFLFAVGGGTLLHFVYDWSGGRLWAAVIGAVNESTWEHMKLLAVPWLVWTAVEWAVLGRTVLGPRAAGLGAALALIPTLYYTYAGALGGESTLVHILIFHLAAALGWQLSLRLQRRGRLATAWVQGVALLALAALAVAAVWWMLAPPALPLFRPPVG